MKERSSRKEKKTNQKIIYSTIKAFERLTISELELVKTHIEDLLKKKDN